MSEVETEGSVVDQGEDGCMSSENQEVLGTIETLLTEMPHPLAEDHPHQVEIARFRLDFEGMLKLARSISNLDSILEELLSSDEESEFDSTLSSPEVRDAWIRFQEFPFPTDAEHRFLNEIYSSVDAFRVLLVALSRAQATG